MNPPKNDLISAFLQADQILDRQTRLNVLYNLQTQKEKLFNLKKNPHLSTELKDFNERICPRSPSYGSLYA